MRVSLRIVHFICTLWVAALGPQGGPGAGAPHCPELCTEVHLTWCWFVLQVTRPHPSDHPLLIFFVVGGITVSEAKMIKDLVPSLKPGTQVQGARGDERPRAGARGRVRALR